MAIDPVWAGVIGTAVGAVAGGATSLLAPLINWRTEEKRLTVEKQNAKELADHQHALDIKRLEQEAKATELASKRELIAMWRQGVSDAHDDYVDATAKAHDRQSRGLGFEVKPAPVVGTPWFETLRPHLDENMGDIYTDFIIPHDLFLDDERAKRLSAEVTRIAREWNA